MTLKVIYRLQAFSDAIRRLRDFNWQCARTVPLHFQSFLLHFDRCDLQKYRPNQRWRSVGSSLSGGPTMPNLFLLCDQGSLVDLRMQDYKFLCVSVAICSALINIQTDTDLETNTQYFD